jgi:hypothetical protein
MLVFCARPQVNGAGFDPALVLANLDGNAAHTAAPFTFRVELLLFSTDPSSGVMKPMTVEAVLYEDRVTAAGQAPGSLTQLQAASVM